LKKHLKTKRFEVKMSTNLIYMRLTERRENLENLRNLMDQLVAKTMRELEEIKKDVDMIHTTSNVTVYISDNIWQLL